MCYLLLWQYYGNHYYLISYSESDLKHYASFHLHCIYFKPIKCNGMKDAKRFIQCYAKDNRLEEPIRLEIQQIVRFQRC